MCIKPYVENSVIRVARIRKERILSQFADYIPLIFQRYTKRLNTRRRVRRSAFSWQNIVAALLVLASIASGFATYAALNEVPPFGNDPDTVIWLLTLDLVLLLSLVALVARRIVALWSGRKRGLAGSHLHVRLVYIFSFMAAVPAIIMTVAFVFFFYYGVQAWFSQRVQTAVNESQEVAEAYLEEHKQVIRADTLAMANDLDRQAGYFMANEAALNNAVQTQSILRNLSEALVFDSSGRVLARSNLTFSLEFEEIPSFAMRQAEEGEVALMTGANEDRVRALIKLGNFFDAYLFVGRMVDPNVLGHVTATRQASQDYQDLQMRSSRLQIMVTMIFTMIGLLLMFAAIWFGFVLARQLVAPISDLITTSDRVRAGDLAARVSEFGTIEEFDYLARSFNRMTKQVEEQQNALIEANRQMDRRRRFTETVLAGVTSGVIGLDSKGKITLANTMAAKLLGLEQGKMVGKKIGAFVKEFEALLKEAHKRPRKIAQAEIPVSQDDGERHSIFFVRIAIERIEDEEVGAIITFDDITDLQSAQRKAAWSDVARRIAHEIKNPLTPIHLSAERLKRKYLKEIESDPDTFSQCTDTIIKHVEDIGRMVDEFSSFARMPEPVMVLQSLNGCVKEILALRTHSHEGVTVTLSGADDLDYMVRFDAQQVRQALNNLIQNAVDSVEARMARDEEQGVKNIEPGKVEVFMMQPNDHDVFIGVSDNGLGLPKGETASSLTEPYVTHKLKGTGLGLAIVKKIMEDHNGEAVIGVPEWLADYKEWHDLGGATMGLLFDVDQHADVNHAKKKKERKKASKQVSK